MGFKFFMVVLLVKNLAFRRDFLFLGFAFFEAFQT